MLAEYGARYEAALVAGDAAGARRLIDGLLRRGIAPVAIQSRLIAPALCRIGDAWERGTLTIVDDHLASTITQDMLEMLAPALQHAAPQSRERILLAATSGEQHALGLRMAADVLKGAGFEVFNLGADMPTEDLLRACATHEPALLGLSATTPQSVLPLMATIDGVRALDHPPATIVGGAAASQAVNAGLDTTLVNDTESLLDVVESLLSARTETTVSVPARPYGSPNQGGLRTGRRLAQLTMPPVVPHSVDRPRLWEALDVARDLPLVMIVGPAGSGKSNLVSSWVKARRPGRVVWVSITPGEDDRDGFWHEVQQAATAAGIGEDGPQQATPNAIVDRLARGNRPGEDDLPTFLVLDDAHELTDPQIREDVAAIARNAPPGLHLIVTSRTGVALHTQRMVLAEQAAVIPPGQLAFRLEETEALFERLDVALDHELLQTIHQRTEGWAAVLRLAALSLRSGMLPGAVVEQITGDSATLSDYLIEEVFDRLSAPEREFLMRTSILSRISGPLADAVTGRPGGGPMLESLHARGFPLAPLDEQRIWMRPSPRLVAEFLLHELTRTHSDEDIAAMHERAAGWYSEHDDPVEAIRHALASSRSTELTVTLLRAHHARLLVSTQMPDVLALIEGASSPLWQADPIVGHTAASGALATGDRAAAKRWTAIGDRAAAPQSPGDALRAALARIASELLVARTDRDLEASRQLGAQIISLLDGAPMSAEDHDALEDLAATDIGASHLWRGNAAAAEMAMEGDDTRGRREPRILAHRAVAHVWSGALQDADMLARKALTADSGVRRPRDQGTDVLAHHVLAATTMLRGHAEAAGRHIDDQAVDDLIDPFPRAFARYNQIERYYQLGRYDEALDMGARAYEENTVHPGLPEAATAFAGLRARVLVAAGRVDEAAELMAQPAFADSGRGVIGLAYVRRHQGYPRECMTMLEPQLEAPSETVSAQWQILALLTGALAASEDRDDTAALNLAVRAIAQAAPGPIRSPFWETDSPRLRSLIGRSDLTGADAVFAAEFLGREAVTRLAVGSLAVPEEQLSGREAAVLRFLPGNLTNHEIADQLFVSVNTVKTHLKSIYAKFGVHTRREAIVHARSRGLLPR